MSGDRDDAARTPGPAPDVAAPATVFGAPNQDEIIARIDAVAEDDLASGFFENSMQDVEAAAVRMFDVGVRTLTDDEVPGEAFGGAAPPQARPEPARPPVAQGADGQFDDPAVRRAFILGGPAALAR